MNVVFTLASILPLLAILAPILLIAGLSVARTCPVALRLAPWGALPGLVCALLPAGGDLNLPWLLLGSSLELDTTGRSFLFLFGMLWLAAGLYTRGYLADDPKKKRFWIFFLLTMCGNLGLPLAKGVLDFYLFFALMSFAAYGLVVHDNSPSARRAGRLYLSLVLIGEVLLFVGFGLAVNGAQSLRLTDISYHLATADQRDLIIGLLLAGFGIKAGIIPLHIWLPLAHPAAPVPASAVLSGAMIKAGLLGLMRLLPLGEALLPGWSQVLIISGIIMAFYGVLVGLCQIQAKTVLAYSSISQMGFPLIGLGLGLAQPAAWPLLTGAVTFYALHHGLAKGTLFLGVGMSSAPSTGSPRRLLIATLLILPALSLSGAPLTSGALAKSALKPFLGGAPDIWAASLPWLLSLAAIGTTLILARFLFVLYAGTDQGHTPKPSMWAGFGLSAGGVLLCAAALVPLGENRLEMPSPGWNQLWPVAVGILLAGAFWFRSRGRSVAQEPVIPASDLFVLLESAGTAGNMAGIAAKLSSSLQKGAAGVAAAIASIRLSGAHDLPPVFELVLRRLPAAGVCFTILLLLLLFL
ncbi:MAG: complex I subunit 5 family protein [Desulfobulbaceae bacterium]|nr:complex I subunit 5 family protein [Desulfobulbaceae bacterium]